MTFKPIFIDFEPGLESRRVEGAPRIQARHSGARLAQPADQRESRTNFRCAPNRSLPCRSAQIDYNRGLAVAGARMTSASIIAKPDPGTGGTGTSRWSWPPPPSSPSSLPISAAPPGPRPSPNSATQANGTKGVRHRKRRDTHTELANNTRNPSALRKAHIRRSIPPCLHMGLVPMATNPPVRRGPLSSTTTAQYATVVLDPAAANGGVRKIARGEARIARELL